MSRETKTTATNQHYVPQFLLRNFGAGKRKHIWVFDKHTESQFRSHPRNLACERDFYEIEDGQSKVSIDQILTRVETQAAPIIQKVLQTKRLTGLSTLERVVIASFAAAQLVRTKGRVEMWEDFNAKLCTALEAMGANLDNIEGYTPLRTPAEVRSASFQALPQNAKQLTPYFVEKSWVLYETDSKHPFFIGDNPVAMHNTIERPHRGNLGLGVVGIEVYLPLSSTLQLAFLCPTIEQNARTAVPFSEVSPLARRVSNLAHSLESGIPLQMKPENVVFQNSLQVSNASRYVYCCINEFDLAVEMVRTHPENRFSPRTSMR